MSDHFIKFQNGSCIISCPNIYKYKGLVFEFHSYLGPFRLNKNLEPSKRNFSNKEYEIISQWVKLTPSKKKRTLIYN